MARFIAAIASLICMTSGFMAQPAMARPVSYEGGWTLIEETDRQSTALWVHYTVNPSLSLGWRTEWDRQNDVLFNGPQATWLAKRWFGENYQANLYGFAGAGALEGINGNPADREAAAFIGAMADWETRRLFASYRVRGLEGGDVDGSFMQAARVGFAPYEGDTGDLHTWLMVEVDHRPDAEDPVGVTPLVRFFKGAALFEAGWSVTDDEPMLNFQYRF
ncbi:hypothetical protein FF098_009195 [Parvularcula flava]|uniref:Uncharacterized protein n=1 Tax=Aquisalinus luteolus TaxID=1566827 RepID=A0A8J3A6Y2_9PROT|nr:hypothetical protein [Aquisalinus luteolus]NHK28077.1 hypothetical protein [Aquisalinus luteolus]GGH97385.1 hypothetical protein GCM10011355_18500 [Aquisalinus luteolus]